MNTETKTCQNCKNQFIIEPEDFNFYKKINVPPPTWCPECRFQRRAIFRNERKLFRGKSALSQENILTLYPPEAGYTLYKDEEWNTDVWDPAKYGQEVDFSRPFLAQLHELNKKVPKAHASVLNMVNSEYSANAAELKNCYLLFNSNHTEDSAYGNAIDSCKSCVDNSHLQKCERCYGSFWLTKCYETHFSSRCEDCNDVWFSRDCRGCSDCFGCVNLRMQKYRIFNVQYSKEEYETKLKAMNLSTWSGFSRVSLEARSFWIQFPNKFLQGIQNTNVSGEFITHSKNTKNSYLVREGEDLKYCQYIQVPPGKDSYDASIAGWGMDLIYEGSVCGWQGGRLKFCFECWSNAYDLEYCMFCKSSSNLFGCAGMRNKKYCILNKQYSREDYFVLREKIIAHMNVMPYKDAMGREYRYGEFFPPEFSPFAYDQTITPEHFPLTKEEAAAQGFRWSNPSPTEYQTTMNATDLPDAIADISDEISKEVIKCAECGRAYRIIPQEIQFLKQNSVPAPRTCVDCRHWSRISQRNRAKLYARVCQCAGDTSENGIYKNTVKHSHEEGYCPNKFETSYAPERPDIIYCEQCYNAEVV
ncbi:MAG: hypothetical protein UY26_C0003G0112 [Candidatus Jorgensenbacteria bacterium GW2011_GWA1_48_13]|uniref:Uncharacterized protein n=1 Tax=Candidatus Jorgensenbacteria bacterium GW2011_GWB1_50_10 TaxID=1618665 RepID=A0A0G1W8Y6_9BACT|nr:MAG: hypothetical protein UY26_C0003G0112 [Candidatus Jorgensenbacteria bacterium GW2011_GWA1_48_13]KKW15070.1 MAG: hypothetical protein UY55_C0002G0128 [Candidatus Jorgensenbacteria bacterium GW2011_GWB1_50_10]